MYLPNYDPYDETGSISVSVPQYCPISERRLDVDPCRGILCRHYRCFSQAAFERIRSEGIKTWKHFITTNLVELKQELEQISEEDEFLLYAYEIVRDGYSELSRLFNKIALVECDGCPICGTITYNILVPDSHFAIEVGSGRHKEGVPVPHDWQCYEALVDFKKLDTTKLRERCRRVRETLGKALERLYDFQEVTMLEEETEIAQSIIEKITDALLPEIEKFEDRLKPKI